MTGTLLSMPRAHNPGAMVRKITAVPPSNCRVHVHTMNELFRLFFLRPIRDFCRCSDERPVANEPNHQLHGPQFIYLLAAALIDGRILFNNRQSTSDRIRPTFRPGDKSRHAVRTAHALKYDI
jgi:hypothetical protein